MATLNNDSFPTDTVRHELHDLHTNFRHLGRRTVESFRDVYQTFVTQHGVFPLGRIAALITPELSAALESLVTAKLETKAKQRFHSLLQRPDKRNRKGSDGWWELDMHDLIGWFAPSSGGLSRAFLSGLLAVEKSGCCERDAFFATLLEVQEEATATGRNALFIDRSWKPAQITTALERIPRQIQRPPQQQHNPPATTQQSHNSSPARHVASPPVSAHAACPSTPTRRLVFAPVEPSVSDPHEIFDTALSDDDDNGGDFGNLGDFSTLLKENEEEEDTVAARIDPMLEKPSTPQPHTKNLTAGTGKKRTFVDFEQLSARKRRERAQKHKELVPGYNRAQLVKPSLVNASPTATAQKQATANLVQPSGEQSVIAGPEGRDEELDEEDEGDTLHEDDFEGCSEESSPEIERGRRHPPPLLDHSSPIPSPGAEPDLGHYEIANTVTCRKQPHCSNPSKRRKLSTIEEASTLSHANDTGLSHSSSSHADSIDFPELQSPAESPSSLVFQLPEMAELTCLSVDEQPPHLAAQQREEPAQDIPSGTTTGAALHTVPSAAPAKPDDSTAQAASPPTHSADTGPDGNAKAVPPPGKVAIACAPAPATSVSAALDSLQPGRWVTSAAFDLVLQLFIPAAFHVVDASTAAQPEGSPPYRHLRNVETARAPSMVLPLYTDNHWAVALIRPPAKSCLIMDSWKTKFYDKQLNDLALRFCSRLANGNDVYNVSRPNDFPKQRDETSCGVLAMLNVLFRTTDSFATAQQNIDVDTARYIFTIAIRAAYPEAEGTQSTPAPRLPELASPVSENSRQACQQYLRALQGRHSTAQMLELSAHTTLSDPVPDRTSQEQVLSALRTLETIGQLDPNIQTHLPPGLAKSEAAIRNTMDLHQKKTLAMRAVVMEARSVRASTVAELSRMVDLVGM